MKLTAFLAAVLISMANTLTAQNQWVIVIHGGAGIINRSNISPEQEASYRAALDSALDIGAGLLANGGSSADAVEATIRFLEDNPLFNAGRGAVLNAEGRAELDASFMTGQDRKAGAVAGLQTTRHPISAARRVMDGSPHVMLAGPGAEEFARSQGLEQVNNQFFITESRLRLLRSQQGKEAEGNDGAPLEKKFGTVGCVALDLAGNLAAGTSTGGMSNKRFGRVGDSPVIGAGTFADNRTCAVSCTGHGEFFIRWVVAYDVAAMMEYGGLPLAEAADMVVMQKLAEAGGDGGLIALDAAGNIAMPFNSEGMYRGYRTSSGEQFIGIFREE